MKLNPAQRGLSLADRHQHCSMVFAEVSEPGGGQILGSIVVIP